MRTRLFLLHVCLGTTLAQQLCFIRTDSTVRRDAVAVVTAISQQHCNFRCIDTPGCEACMFYPNTSRCVLMGAQRTPIPGACPAPYACYEKRYSGCPARPAPPAVDYGYVPGECSRPSDVTGPPAIGRAAPCGRTELASPDRRVVLDTIGHDGTHQIRENYQDVNSLNWDPYLWSWYHKLDNVKYYFASATCVLPPVTPLTPACACQSPIPSEPPMDGYSVYAPQPTPATNDVQPACPGSIQIHYKRVMYDYGGTYDYRRVKSSFKQSIFCAMGEWMFLLDNSASYSMYSIIAAVCVA